MSQNEEVRRRILWVDDEIEFLRAHIFFLEDHGWIVDKATNGHDAVAMAAEQGYDVVLLDEQMAGLDGLTTLQHLKKANPSLFVVMCTKSEEEKVMEEAIGKNIDGYLTKPINPNQIVSLCQSLFKARSLRSNHLTSRYVRQYAENKARLLGPVQPADWENVHLRLAQWDLDLSWSGNEGLRETHNGQREETENGFVNYLESNWYGWNGRDRFKPNFIWNFIPRRVIPRIKDGQSPVVLVLTGLRTDLWLSMQSLVEGLFEIKVEHHWSTLPGVPEVSRVCLFGADQQKVLGAENPAWNWPTRDAISQPTILTQLLMRALRDCNLKTAPEVFCVANADEGKRLAKRADSIGEAPVTFVMYEFARMLNELRKPSQDNVPQPATIEEYRSLARRMLAHSGLYQLLYRLQQANREVLLISDSGSLLVHEPIEVFCASNAPHDFRVQFGQDISCDERHAFFLENPISAGLSNTHGPVALAKGERFFASPNKYQYYGTGHVGKLVTGGLSMAELLVPLCTLTPR